MQIQTEIPDHVPAELIRNFNHFTSPGFVPEPGANPYVAIQKLYDGPRIFYAPQEGRMLSGNWVVTRNEDMRKILSDTDSFSSWAIAGFSHLLGETWDMIPLEVDPPHHLKYRALLNPLFTPSRVKEMSDKIRGVAIELIDNIKAKGSCEFVNDFARRFPVRIFMDLMGIPLEDYDTILEWEDKILHSPDMDVRVEGALAIRDYLVRLLEERKGKPPMDVLGHIANGEVEGRPMTDTEQLSMSLFLFVAGLDTVASSLGYVFMYLASNPEAQEFLREDKTRIPAAVEELMRTHAVVVTSRKVTRDIEIAGVQMKKGDVVSLPLCLGNYDPAVFPDASEIKLDRKPNPHIAFTVGPHRCLGSHLARTEVGIAIEEWVNRMPGFKVLAGTQPVARGGAVFGVDEMHFDWDK